MAFASYLVRPPRCLAEQITEPNGRDVPSIGGTMHGNQTDWDIDQGGGYHTIMTDVDFKANFIIRSAALGL